VKTRTMPAGLFKSKCLAVMDEVQAKCETVIITKHGKPVAKLMPVDPKRDDFYGSMKGKVIILGDIVGPVIPEEEWNLG
jgi:prevent-host-death family protein